MKRIVNTLKILLIIALFPLFMHNAKSQTPLYNTGFEFPAPYKNVLMSLYDSVEYDHWITNSKSVQYTFTRCVYNLLGGSGDEDDSLRNTWCFLNSAQLTNGGLTPLNPNCNSIKTQSLGLCALNGPNGFTVNEYNFDCDMNTIVRNGVYCYFNNVPVDRWAYRPVATTGYSNITLTFDWRCGGTTTSGYGQIGYSLDKGKNWTWMAAQYYGKPTTQAGTVVVFPAACNDQANFAMGFRFYADGKAGTTDEVLGPTFVIDNIKLTGDTGPVQCSVPTMTALANTVSGQYVVCPRGGQVPLTLNANAQGSPASGTWQYSWFNGSKYWDGSDFIGTDAKFDASYATVVTTGKDSVKYTVSAQCSNAPGVTSQSSVVTIILKDPSSITTAIGTPANGPSNHMNVSWGKVNGSNYKLEYSTDRTTWQSTGFTGNKTTYDHNLGAYPNKPVFYRVQSYVGSDGCGDWVSLLDTAFTACNFPILNTSNPTPNTLDFSLGNDNNPSYTLYSITCQSCDAAHKYLKLDGKLDPTQFYYTMSQWQATKTIKGLNSATNYCFVATAKNKRNDLQTIPQVCATTGQCIPVSIVSQTTGQIVKCTNDNIAIEVNATGSETVKYQWYKGVVPISYASTSVLTYNKLASWNSDLYHCVLANKCGSQTSSNVTLIVNSKPIFDVAPVALDKNTGDLVTLSVVPSGGGAGATYTYQWYKDGNKLDGETNNVFTINSVTSADAGIYSCKVTDSCGDTTQNIATLSVDDTGSELFGIVSYDNKNSTPLHDVTVNINNKENTFSNTINTDAVGYYQFKSLTPDDYVVTATTTKAWGGVTPIDAFLANKIFVGILPMPVGVKFLAADVNKDNKINSVDALMINRRYIGTLKSFPAGLWVFNNDTVPVDGYISHNLQGLCVGDVNADYANIPRLTPDINLVTNQVLQITNNESFEMPVRVTRDLELGALGLKFRVSGSEFRVIDIKSDIKGLIYNIEGNDVAIAWSAMNENLNMKNNDILFTLVMSSAFQVAGTNVELTIDPTSVLADGSANRLENETLSIPGLSFNNSQFAVRSFPNPFSNITNIEYTLPEACNVSLKIYNILGVEIANLVNTNQDAGAYKVTFNGTDLPGGAYMYKLTANGESRNYNQTKLMILSR